MTKRPIIFTTELIPKILDGAKTQTRRVLKPQPKYLVGEKYSQWFWCKKDVSEIEAMRLHLSHAIWWDGVKTPRLMIPFCPYGQVGDRLCVRETWAVPRNLKKASHLEVLSYGGVIFYKANGDTLLKGNIWKSPLFMPRWASRITLEITGIRVERLQEITPEDCVAEGYPFGEIPLCRSDRELTISKQMRLGWYKDLWNSLNAKWKPVYNKELKIYEYWQFPWAEEDAKPIPKTTNHPERYHCVPNPWVWVIEFKKVDCSE